MTRRTQFLKFQISDVRKDTRTYHMSSADTRTFHIPPIINISMRVCSRGRIQRSMRGVLREAWHEGGVPMRGSGGKGSKGIGPKTGVPKGGSQGTWRGSSCLVESQGREYPGALRNMTDIKIFDSYIWNVRRTSDTTDIALLFAHFTYSSEAS